MQKLICGMLMVAVLLAGCRSGGRKTSTPVEGVHNVPPAVYPGAKSESPQDAGQAYPGPGKSAGATPIANTYAPAAGDDKLDRGEAFVEIQDSELLTLETNPPQVNLHLKGNLPNPCHQLRVNPSKPDNQNHIQVEVYSVSEPGKMCTEVLQAFEATIPLGSFPKGHYSVSINEELLGEFDIK